MRRLTVALVLALAPALAGASDALITTEPRAASLTDTNAAAHNGRADHDHHAAAPGGHEGDEGLALRPAAETPGATPAGGLCDSDAPVRRYDIAAFAVDITLNRYGDHDPTGRMYALLERIDAIRDAARRGADAVSLGLQGDAVQPLVLRATPGECLQVRLTNRLADEPASFHVHGAALVLSATGAPAIASEPAALAAPGAMVAYEWMIPDDEPEGTHVFHSHGDARAQSGHGLFGTLVVEPPGSTWSDPRTGMRDTTGWDAVISPEGGTPFREFVLAYHEIGNEDFRITRADGTLLPVVDPITQAYRPGSRALNYRSEPFYNRLALQQERFGTTDESLAYSSYAFGDPATPILRTYLGEPVKERVVHAGAEVFHVHHVHGGSVRWRRQPAAGPTGQAAGIDKHPAILPGASERTDSQGIGPSESFDIDHECGAGGCQQGAGDYLVHCHVAHHYFAGMWGIWRVYNTQQDGRVSTDTLPPFAPLRSVDVSPAVDSAQLEPAAATRAKRHLPPAGRGDASLWDWVEDGGRILGEPETGEVWSGYDAATPGVRPPVLFDPATGAPAYPMLRPHLGARPPFAPGHGPAPFFDPPAEDAEPPPPGASGPTSLCPAGTDPRQFVVRAIELPVPINAGRRVVDPAGMLFVLAEDEARLRADPSTRQPLAIRANAGEHCVDVLLTNEIPDNASHPFSKISLHMHHVQFDVQGSDGVDTGFSFEQTIRPLHTGGGRLRRPARRGDSDLVLDGGAAVPLKALLAVGADDGVPEIRRVTATSGPGRYALDRPLERDHPAGEWATTEFLRIRWYPDAQVGTSYFHDHVNGIKTWQRGLVGALIVEPPGATYHDPHTGAEVRSGAMADVRAPAGRPVSADVRGSFRELVSFIQEGSPLTNVDRSAGANFNLRAEPLDRRPGPRERAFSSTVHGDPATPLVEAYVGDPVVVRATVGATNEMHTWHLDGHWFRREPWSTGSAPTSTVHLGISERMDLVVPAAGGPQRRAGDYLYANGRALKLREGAWGLLRVHRYGADDPLQPLPGRRATEQNEPPICPASAPRKRFHVLAIETRLPMLGAAPGRMFVLADDAPAVLAGDQIPTPLVLRAAVGDCLRVTLDNRLPDGTGPVSLHADGLAYDPLTSGGIEAGRNPPQVVGRGGSRTFTYFAHPDYGQGAALLRDGADLGRSGRLGLYGAVVIGPRGTTYRPATGWQAVATTADGRSWRDVALLLHDEDDAIGTHRMPYTTAVRGAVGVNYGRGDTAPTAEAYAGDPVRVHVLAPWSEQAQVFTLEGHRWPIEPGMNGSTRVESVAIGGLESITVIPDGGAGGVAQLPGTYQWGDHREPFREAGLWGRFIVHDACRGRAPTVPVLTDRSTCPADGIDEWIPWVIGASGIAAIAVGAILELHRRRRNPGKRGPEGTLDAAGRYELRGEQRRHRVEVRRAAGARGSCEVSLSAWAMVSGSARGVASTRPCQPMRNKWLHIRLALVMVMRNQLLHKEHRHGVRDHRT